MFTVPVIVPVPVTDPVGTTGGVMVYAAELAEESRKPLLDATALSVSELATDTAVEYVVPWVQVPDPLAVGVEPSDV